MDTKIIDNRRMLDIRLKPRFCPYSRALAIATCQLVAIIILLGLMTNTGLAQQKSKTNGKSGVTANTKLEKLEAQLSKHRARHKRLSAKAAKAAIEQAKFRRLLITAGRNAKQRELNLLRAEQRLAELKNQEARLSENLRADRHSLSLVLGALSRLSRRPKPILAAEPGDILDSLRSSLLFASVVPELRARAAKLQTQLSGIDKLRLRISLQKITIAKAQTGLESERGRIKRLLGLKITERKRLQTRAESERRRLEVLAVDAKDLRNLIVKIRLSAKAAEAQQRRIQELKQTQQLVALSPEISTTPPSRKKTTVNIAPQPKRQGTLILPNAPFSQAKGLVQLPVAGHIVRHFGDNDKHGLHAKGLYIKVRSGSQIVAPYDGEIAYAGPFRGYGLLLIIAHGEGYHTLLSGLSGSHVVVGQLVLANEPIGEMVRGQISNLTLYVELRRRGEAINPLPWMAARSDKVNG